MVKLDKVEWLFSEFSPEGFKKTYSFIACKWQNMKGKQIHKADLLYKHYNFC